MSPALSLKPPIKISPNASQPWEQRSFKAQMESKNDDDDIILRAKMTVEMSFCIVLSDEYDIITACF